MCPGIAVLAGGGGAGGGSGKGSKGGKGKKKGQTDKKNKNAKGGKKGASDPNRYPECGTKSHPVDVATGRAFTHAIIDFQLHGPMPLRFERTWSSAAIGVDVGLGPGWMHSFGWTIEVGRRRVVIWTEYGTAVEFELPEEGSSIIGPWGWVLLREKWGFALDIDDGVWRLFSARDGAGRFRLTALEDRNGNRIALTYDDGRLVEILDSAARLIRVDSTPSTGCIAAFRAKNAATHGQWIEFVRYEHDTRGDLIRAIDADGFDWRYEYDGQHRLIKDQDRAGLRFHFQYDSQGRCVEAWGDYAAGDPSLDEDCPTMLSDGATRRRGIHHCKFLYVEDGYTEVSDSTQLSRFESNEHGLIEKQAEGEVFSAQYDDQGFLLGRSDSAGAWTTFERDLRGRIVRVTDPMGFSTSITRDALGLPVRIVDQRASVTEVIRDPRGNVIQEIDAAGGVSTYDWTERGQLAREVDAAGAATHFKYDAAGNITQWTQPNGAAWAFEYDAFGRRTLVRDPLGSVTRFVYSERGDLVIEYGPDDRVVRYLYDGEGHPVEIVDELNRVTKFTWGGYHKLCAIRSPSGRVVTLRYNAEGEVTKVRNELGQEYTFERDVSGRVVRERRFDGSEFAIAYDEQGRVSRVDSRAGTMACVYDLCGRVIERSLPGGSLETFTWDPAGDLLQSSNGIAAVELVRDAVGRIIAEKQTVDGQTVEVEREYDLRGNLRGCKTSLGYRESIVRDEMGLRTSTTVGDLHIRHKHDPLGRRTLDETSIGWSVNSSRDGAGLLTSRKLTRLGGVIADTVRYQRATGGVIQQRNGARGVREWSHDEDDYVTTILNSASVLHAVDYNAAHDAATADGRKYSYESSGRLERVGDATYRWDDDGRLISRYDATEEWHYAWNGAGLLAAATSSSGVNVEFAYDTFARRVRKRVSRAADADTLSFDVRFVWSGDEVVQEIRRRTGSDDIVEERTYAYDDDRFPIGQRDSGRGWAYCTTDDAGRPEQLLTAAGDAHGVEFDPLGRVEEGEELTPLRQLGQYADEETGLYYNRYRYYDPSAGRWISADPVGLGGGFNLYALNGGTTWALDPFGLTVGWNNGYRTPNGKFASPTGPGISGAAAVAQVQTDLQSKGWTPMGTEQSFKQPKGRKCKGQRRRYDLVMKDPNGKVTGVEVKSGSARPTAAQRRFDAQVNAGTQTVGVGQAAGVQVTQSVTISVP